MKNDKMIAGIILAAGKGTRIKSTVSNKVTIPFLNKPMIIYGVELLQEITHPVIVVVGAFADSVKKALAGHDVIFAPQQELLGTADAVYKGLKKLHSSKIYPDLVLVGYGDHMMFYSVKNAYDLIAYHQKEKAALTIVTALLKDPHAYGRVIRDHRKKNVIRIVEEKDASEQEKKIKEINAGLYCFDVKFLKESLPKVPQSPIAHEYYLTDLVRIANEENKKVAGFQIPFENVGIGINRPEELEESEKIYMNNRKS